DEKINDLLYNLEINMKVKREFYNNSEIVFRRSSYNTELKLSQFLYQKRNDITIITGGPGTGKTYNINKYLDEAKKSGLSVAICAPTGRAAKRINEVTGFNAKTIHRLLECVPDKDAKHQKIYFNINEDNKLYVDLLIVDEMSMVDELLMYALIRAIPDGTRILLVGDVDQLPSVGAGQVLKDMIESGYFNVLKLTEIYRQGKESNIVINAHKINKGEDIDLKVKHEDFIFTHKSTDEGVRDAIKTLISKNIPNHFNIGLDQIQVICPSKIGECGTVALNKILQKELNKEDIFKNEIESFGKTLRLHDKVMQTVNNYDIPYDVVDEKENIIDAGIGIYNGDIGEIIEIDEENSTIVIKFDDRIAYYNKDDLKDITHAYAITVHKSQGSEYDVVVMPMTKTPIPLLTRKILYTAMTRAKKCIVFVGQEYYFKEMVKNLIEVKRNTALLSKLFIYDI
ncbi:MAG: AAA family ATPase, partial [Lachnospiraceae bacterium]|nr:AAA family ATPase [Lachnospiraceae bacterium]